MVVVVVAVVSVVLDVSWGAHCHMVVVVVTLVAAAAAAGSDVMLVGMLVKTGVAGYQVVYTCYYWFVPSLSLPLPQPPPAAAAPHFWFGLLMVC